MRLQQLVKKKFSGTPTEFSLLEEWGDLLLLTGQVNYDHLFVVISARRGSIPRMIRPLNVCPGTAEQVFLQQQSDYPVPRPVRRSAGDCVFLRPAWLSNESQHYEKVGKWFYKWFKKS